MHHAMLFPNTVEEFMEQYKVVDSEHVYTNGTEFVPIFRMKQWFDHVSQIPTVSPDEARGVGEITDDDACPVCGCWIPTDDAHDAIFKNEVKFCYYCGTRLRMKGVSDDA